MREIDFRVDILKNGARAGSLPYVTPPTISCASNASIQMSMNGTFADSDLIDYLHDELQPIIIIDGQETPAGIFRAGSVRTVIEDGRKTQEVEAYDRNMWLSWNKLETRSYHASSEKYSTIISDTLTSAGITLFNLSPTTATLQARREWDIGTNYLQIINDLLSELAYDSIWFDGNGYAIMKPYQSPSVNMIDHRYGRGEYRMVGTTRYSELDIFNRPNVFIVVRTSPYYSSVLTATSENNNPMSPLSIVRRGIRIPQVTTVSNIANQTALQTYADRLRDQNMEASEVVQITTAIQPGHGVGDIVALEGTDLDGIYRETGWSITLEAGSWMKHTLERTVL